MENPQNPQQIRNFATGRPFRRINYPQSLQGDSELFGIFSGGPPSHSGFLQKYGKNRAVTFPTRVKNLGTCDLIADVRRELNRQDAKDAKVLADGHGGDGSDGEHSTLNPAVAGPNIQSMRVGSQVRVPLAFTHIHRYSPEFTDIHPFWKKNYETRRT